MPKCAFLPHSKPNLIWHHQQPQQLTPQRNQPGGRPVSTPTTGGRSKQRRTSENDAIFTRSVPNDPPTHSNFVLPTVQRRVFQLPPSHPPQVPPQMPPQVLPGQCAPESFPTIHEAEAICRRSKAFPRPTHWSGAPLQNSKRSNVTTARPTPPTTQTSPLSDVQMREELNKEAYLSLRRYGNNKVFKLQEVRVVDGGHEVGYKRPFNQKEKEELYGPSGAVTNHIKESRKRRDLSGRCNST